MCIPGPGAAQPALGFCSKPRIPPQNNPRKTHPSENRSRQKPSVHPSPITPSTARLCNKLEGVRGPSSSGGPREGTATWNGSLLFRLSVSPHSTGNGGGGLSGSSVPQRQPAIGGTGRHGTVLQTSNELQPVRKGMAPRMGKN